MKLKLTDIANEYERLVNADLLIWHEVDKRLLDESTVRYLETILEPSGLYYQVADVKVYDTVLFKINHETIKYLHHDPDTKQHMWADEGFHNALPNDIVLLELARLAGIIMIDPRSRN